MLPIILWHNRPSLTALLRLESGWIRGHIEQMNAVEIIEEIKQLEPAERAKVLAFVEASRSNQASPEELVALADRMVDADDEKDADALKAQILAGFIRDAG